VVGSRNVGCHSGQLMKVSATLWRMKYVLLFKGHSKHQHVDRGGGGGGGGFRIKETGMLVGK